MRLENFNYSSIRKIPLNGNLAQLVNTLKFHGKFVDR